MWGGEEGGVSVEDIRTKEGGSDWKLYKMYNEDLHYF